MMQNLNRKNSFEDYGAEPSSLVWEKIEKQLPVTSGKKRGWLIWSAAAILVTGLFLSVYVLDIEISFKKKETAVKPAASLVKETGKGSEKSSAQKNNEALVTVPSEKNNSSAEKEKSFSENIASSSSGIKTSVKQHRNLPAKQETAITPQATIEENKTVASQENTIAINKEEGDKIEFIKSISPIDIAMIPTQSNATLALKESSIDFVPMKKNSASRWQWSVAGSENYNYRVLGFSEGNQPLNEGEKNYLSENEKGIQTFAFETGIGYHLSTHFSLNFGINYFTAGQERSSAEITFSNGTAGSSNSIYDVNTSAGTISANGQQVDFAYFNTNDTSLFTHNSNILSPSPHDSSIVQYITLRQEFSFISLPLLIQYQTAEHRFTPYIGLGFSAGYIVKERVTLNDQKLDHDYRRSTNDIIFFAEAQAGVKYRISHKMFLKLQPSLRYGLNSLSGDDSIEWIPYSAGIGAGINFRF